MFTYYERQPSEEPRRIAVAELRQLLDAGANVQILDTRSPAAYDSGTKKIRGSIRISPQDLRAAASLRSDVLTVAYCT